MTTSDSAILFILLFFFIITSLTMPLFNFIEMETSQSPEIEKYSDVGKLNGLGSVYYFTLDGKENSEVVEVSLSSRYHSKAQYSANVYYTNSTSLIESSNEEFDFVEKKYINTTIYNEPSNIELNPESKDALFAILVTENVKSLGTNEVLLHPFVSVFITILMFLCSVILHVFIYGKRVSHEHDDSSDSASMYI